MLVKIFEIYFLKEEGLRPLRKWKEFSARLTTQIDFERSRDYIDYNRLFLGKFKNDSDNNYANEIIDIINIINNIRQLTIIFS